MIRILPKPSPAVTEDASVKETSNNSSYWNLLRKASSLALNYLSSWYPYSYSPVSHLPETQVTESSVIIFEQDLLRILTSNSPGLKHFLDRSLATFSLKTLASSTPCWFEQCIHYIWSQIEGSPEKLEEWIRHTPADFFLNFQSYVPRNLRQC